MPSRWPFGSGTRGTVDGLVDVPLNGCGVDFEHLLRRTTRTLARTLLLEARGACGLSR